jgi:hypothetical protein
MQKEMLDHLHYLNDKGLYNLEFMKDSIKSINLDLKKVIEGSIKKNTLNLNISLLKDSSIKTMYHGTSLENAKAIIKDGFIKSYMEKDRIEYNKIFMSDNILSARRNALEQVKYDSVVISIDITKYQVYTFITGVGKIDGLEWIIWNDVNIKDVKFIYFKDSISMGELTSEEIIQLPIAEPPTKDVFLEAISKLDIHTFGDPFGVHGARHAVRVIFILRNMNQYQLLTTPQKTILAYAGLYHDIGRINNMADETHGYYSYKKTFDEGLIYNVKGLNAEELEIMKFIIIYHCVDDGIAYEALKEFTNIKDVEMCKLLFDMFKDADALDRFRINDFDRKYLRKVYSYEIEEYAEKLYTIDKESKLKK